MRRILTHVKVLIYICGRVSNSVVQGDIFDGGGFSRIILGIPLVALRFRIRFGCNGGVGILTVALLLVGLFDLMDLIDLIENDLRYLHVHPYVLLEDLRYLMEKLQFGAAAHDLGFWGLCGCAGGRAETKSRRKLSDVRSVIFTRGILRFRIKQLTKN